MNRSGADAVMVLLAGYWPRPLLTEEEVAVWGRSLGECEDVDLAVRVMDSLARSGREFRPTAGQFTSEYQARTPRFPPGQPIAEIAVPDEEHRTRDEWFAYYRKILANAKGPLTKSMSRATEASDGPTP